MIHSQESSRICFVHQLVTSVRRRQATFPRMSSKTWCCWPSRRSPWASTMPHSALAGATRTHVHSTSMDITLLPHALPRGGGRKSLAGACSRLQRR